MFGVVWRGIRHRPGRSAVVLLLAMAATAAAVLTPAYGHAAQQSLLADELRHQSVRATQLQLFDARNLSTESVSVTAVTGQIRDEVAGYPAMAVYVDPIEYMRAPALVTGGDYDARVTLAHRQDACEHLVMIEGECAAGPGEVLISQRSADAERVAIGDTLELMSAQQGAENWSEHEIVGVYEPADFADDVYWGRSGYFSHGADPDGVEYLDALFVTDPQAVEAVPERVQFGVDFQLDMTALRNSDIDAVLAALEELEAAGDTADDLSLTVDNNLAGIIESIRSGQSEIRASVPVVAVPLLVLCWFVLFMVVARVTDERAPEIGLAKLRGLRYGSVATFALGEAVLLTLMAVPLGVALGMAVVAAAAELVLADGVSATLTPAVFGYAVVALAGSLVAVAAATRGTLRRGVLNLLQRVPGRTRRRAGLIEGAVAALAVAATVQALTGNSGPITMLAPALLAVVAGLAAARLLSVVARGRLGRAKRAGEVARILALVQLARRTEHRRVVVLLTVALTLLTFGVTAWDLSERNRQLVASDSLGAHAVYKVDADGPAGLMDVVDELDPTGGQLMGVMRTVERYSSENFLVIAAQTDRMPEVMQWRGHDAADLADLAARLHPAAADPVRIEDELTVSATVTQADADKPLQLSARIVEPGEQARNILLGPLEQGRADYEADLPGCAAGCRLVGIGVARYPGDFSDFSFSLTVDGVADAGGEIPVFSDSRWQPSGLTPQNVVFDVDMTDDGLALSSVDADAPDLIAEHVTAPSPMPAVLAGPAPDDDADATRFWFPAAHGKPQFFEAIDTDVVVPRGGARALLVDLEYTDRIAETFTDLAGKNDIIYEVWANAQAPTDLGQRLEAAGVAVSDSESRDVLLDRLSRQPPALALRLYLLAGGAALVLAVGAVALTSAASARSRRHDDAALRLSGVGRSVLRRSAVIEYLHWTGLPLVVGLVAGLVSAGLVLPSVPLVAGDVVGPVDYRLGIWWLPTAMSVAVAALAGTVALAWRSRRRGAATERLPDGRG